MKPYWQSNDGAITVYHARYEDVLAAGCVDVPRVALVHDDPPYGIDLDTDGRQHGKATLPAWDRVVGDAMPFDPSPIIAMDRPLVMWGANNYASRMPDAPGWLAWDKATRNGLKLRQAELELAWSNITRRIQCFRHLWSGAFRESECGSRLGPCQKPIALCLWVYQRAKLAPDALVFVPHLGSGPDLPAARAMGLRIIGCDVEQWCCDTAIARLPDAPIEIVARAKEWQRRAAKPTPERAAEPVGPLFATVPR